MQISGDPKQSNGSKANSATRKGFSLLYLCSCSPMAPPCHISFPDFLAELCLFRPKGLLQLPRRGSPPESFKRLMPPGLLRFLLSPYFLFLVIFLWLVCKLPWSLLNFLKEETYFHKLYSFPCPSPQRRPRHLRIPELPLPHSSFHHPSQVYWGVTDT